MYRRLFLSALFLTVLPGIIAAQEKTAVFEFEGIGVDAQTVESATHIFRSELNATGKFSVIARGDVQTALAANGIADAGCHSVVCASEYGYMAGAEKSIVGSLTMLGNRITAEIRVVSVVGKNIIFTDSFKANSTYDLDMVLRKLARAAASGKKITSEVDRFAITEEETMDPRRKKSYITSGASLGFGVPLGDSYSGMDRIVSVAWMMRYEAGHWVLENSLGISWGRGGEKDTTYLGRVTDKRKFTVIPWDIGLRYVFNRQADFTPFVGGGLGLHFIGSQTYAGYMTTDRDEAIAFHLAAGMYGFQSYDFRLAIEAKYTVLFSDAFIDSGSTSHQIGLSLSVSRKLVKGEKRGCMSGGCLF